MLGDAFSPVSLLEEGGQESKGEQARMASIVGALAIADLVKTSLGPKGMDKILQSTSRGGHVSVTNDGATILKSVLIDVCPYLPPTRPPAAPSLWFQKQT